MLSFLPLCGTRQLRLDADVPAAVVHRNNVRADALLAAHAEKRTRDQLGVEQPTASRKGDRSATRRHRGRL